MGVKDADKDFMIFDTLNDPQESKDLASSKPELQARMKAAALSNRRASLPSKTVFDTALVPAVETKGAPSPGFPPAQEAGCRAWRGPVSVRQDERAPEARGGIDGVREGAR